MKKLITVLLLFAISKSYGQNAYSTYEKCLATIDSDEKRALADLESNWYEENPDPKRYATMACDAHGPKFQCIRHHRQCTGSCTCYSQYSQQAASITTKFKSARDACESNYKKASVAEAAKAEEEKKKQQEKEEAEEKKLNAKLAAAKQSVNTPQSSKAVSQSPATKSASNTQQQQYQQQTTDYLNAANNATNDIEKAKDLNLAKINAIASKNTTQVSQIQQQQNQQTIQNLNTLGNQLIALLNKPKETYHQPTKAEQKAEIERRVREDFISRGYIFDAQGNAIPPEQVAEMKYDVAHIDEYKRNVTRMGQYVERTFVTVTPDSIKKWDNHATQKETMDFIAGTIWKYTDKPAAAKLCNVTDEIAFVDSVFIYKYQKIWMFHNELNKTYEDKLDFSSTNIYGFVIYPSSSIVYQSDELYCNDGVDFLISAKEGKLNIWLPLEAVEDGVPDQLVKAFTHLIVLCHGKLVVPK